MRLKDIESWLTAAEAARELGISRQAMNKRLAENKHRSVKTHYGYLVDPKSVEKVEKMHTGVSSHRA